MISASVSRKDELDILSDYDPFHDKRITLSIRRAGTWYDISLIDINDQPLYDYFVLCVHGWGSNALNFRYLLKFLAPYCRVVAYDLKGHGESTKEDDSYDIGLFTEELAQIIDYYNPKNLILIGHSMGTAIVMNYLYHNPMKAKTAILLSGAADFKEPFPKLLPIVFPNLDEKIKNMIIDVASYLIQSKSIPKELSLLVKKHRKQTPYYVYRKSLLNTVFAWHKGDELKQIRTPTLIMVGEKDTITPVKQSYELNKLLPNSRMLIFPESKHEILIEKGKEVSDLIKEYIEFLVDKDRTKKDSRISRVIHSS
jgi:pimeloyl-ACP methyl ester carboxylesterase